MEHYRTSKRAATAALAAAALAVAWGPEEAASLPGEEVAVLAPGSIPSCARAEGVERLIALDPPDYYAFSLVATERVPEARGALGSGEVTFARSPYGVAVAPDGSFVYDVRLSVSRLRTPPSGTFVAWVTTPSLDRVRRIGPLDESGAAAGRVEWNKFLVVITLEESNAPEAERWSGPVALRGMSRSGRMHTMAGHGPFQQENCASYGFGG